MTKITLHNLLNNLIRVSLLTGIFTFFVFILNFQWNFLHTDGIYNTYFKCINRQDINCTQAFYDEGIIVELWDPISLSIDISWKYINESQIRYFNYSIFIVYFLSILLFSFNQYLGKIKIRYIIACLAISIIFYYWISYLTDLSLANLYLIREILIILLPVFTIWVLLFYSVNHIEKHR